MWTAIFSFVTGVLPGLAGKFLDWQVQRSNLEMQGFVEGGKLDLAAYQAHLSAQVEVNRMRLAQNGWWGAKLIILTAGVPCALHFASIIMDSMPFPVWGGLHVVGSWGVPAAPAPYDTYEWAIVQSFFLIMPAMPLANAAAVWLGRKR